MSFNNSLSLSMSSSENLNNLLDMNLSDENSNESRIITCIEEFKKLTYQLKNKSNYLKEWEKRLKDKEANILNLSNNLNNLIKTEIKTKTKNIISEISEVNLKLSDKYILLKKNYERLQKSYGFLKVQNNSLKEEIANLQSHEEILNKQIIQFKKKSSMCIFTNKSPASSYHQNVTTQTINDDSNRARILPHKEVKIDNLLPLVSVMRNIWAQLYGNCLRAVLSERSQDSSESITDLSLLVIPIIVDNLKTVFASGLLQNGATIKINKLEIMFHYLEILHWSFVYLDIRRISVRKTMLSSLSRLSEHLILFLKHTFKSTPNKSEFINVNLDLQIITLLVTLRTVTHTNEIALVLNWIIEITANNNQVLSMFLSKCMLVPLLCRWCSVINCCGVISSKVINLMHQTLETTANISLQNSPTILSVTGLDLLILISIRMPIVYTDSEPSRNYHILVLLVDLLYASNGSNIDLIEVIRKMMKNKVVKNLFKDLGIVGIISNMLSKSSVLSELQTTPQCLVKLKELLNQLNIRGK